jgi:RNA polymerase sigma factor (sigma-70 family)
MQLRLNNNMPKLVIELVRTSSIPQREKATVEEHLGLAHAVASQFVNPNERLCVRDSEEFAEACIALMMAVEKDDTSMPLKAFASFAWRSMRNTLIDLHRKRSKQPELADLDSSTLEGKVESFNATELVNTVMEGCREDNTKDRRDRQLLREVYLNGRSVADIAKAHDVSRPIIYKRMRAAMENIKERFPGGI